MPKVLGMEVTVGKEPAPLSLTAIKSFNEVFSDLVVVLKSKESISFHANYSWSSGRENEFLTHGYFTIRQVLNWLAYHQLVKIEKTKESYEDKWSKEIRNRTVWTVSVTKLGRQAFKHGEIIECKQGCSYNSEAIKIGIGKPYPLNFAVLWKRVLLRAEAEGVSRTRRESWHSDFRDFWIDNQLTAMKTAEAEKSTDKFASGKIAAAPKKGVRRKSLRSETQSIVNHQLAQWC